MTWYAFQGHNNGKAVDIAGSQEKEATVLGFHGYGSESQAEAHPNSVNLLNSWFVNAIVADYNAALKEQAQPGGKNANILNPGTAVKAGTSYVENSIPGIAQIGDFFGRLTEGNTWIRVGEVILGVFLIMSGVMKLSGASGDIKDIVKKVPL